MGVAHAAQPMAAIFMKCLREKLLIRSRALSLQRRIGNIVRPANRVDRFILFGLPQNPDDLFREYTLRDHQLPEYAPVVPVYFP